MARQQITQIFERKYTSSKDYSISRQLRDCPFNNTLNLLHGGSSRWFVCGYGHTDLINDFPTNKTPRKACCHTDSSIYNDYSFTLIIIKLIIHYLHLPLSFQSDHCHRFLITARSPELPPSRLSLTYCLSNTKRFG